MNQEICRTAVYSEDYLDLIIEYNGIKNPARGIFTPEQIVPLNYKYAVTHVLRSQAPPLNITAYEYSTIPECLGLMDIVTADRAGVSLLRNQPALGLSGQGVMIGLVDTGIDYTNPLFLRADGTSKIFSIWDQSIDTAGHPESSYYGTEYTSEMINAALLNTDPYSIVPSRDDNGHGTRLAALAGGNYDPANEFTGMAPGAELVVVKLKPAKQILKDFHEIPADALAYQSNDLMAGVQYLLQTAENLKRPISIIIGLGTNSGGLGTGGVLGQFFTQLGRKTGVCVSCAAGNEGAAGHCYLSPPGSGANSEMIELSVGDESGFIIELWGKAPNVYSLAIQSPIGEFIQRIPPRNRISQVYNLLMEDTIIQVDYQLTERSSGEQVIIVRFQRPTPGIWRFEIFKEEFNNTGFIMKLPITNFLSDATRFLNPSPDYTVVNPSVTPTTLCVTAYSTLNNSIYHQSGQGYIDIFTIKPDLAAPGVDILVPTLSHGFTTASGTSLAAACVGGSAALVLEWAIVRGYDSSLNGKGVANLIIRGAESSQSQNYPNDSWGYGRLNLYESFNRLLRL